MSAVMKIVGPPEVMQMFVGTFGYPAPLLPRLAILELTCVAFYAFPRTAVLGAVLLTGYLGGAIATHVRIGDPFIAQTLLGMLVWGGLYLREERLRALLPIRTRLV